MSIIEHMYDVDKTFKTAREFFNFLIDKNIFEPEGIFDVSDKLTNSYVFRGQAQKDWVLLPTAHRENNRLENYTPQPPHESLKSDRLEYVKFQTHAEIRSVYLFLEAADHVGIKTPIDYNMFKGQVDGSDEIFKQELLPSIALAQHHGISTRLIDWTESPFIASYFAAESARTQAEGSYFSIICLSTHLLKDLESIDLVSAPKANNRFLRAQRGLFTIIKSANSYYIENGEWPSLESIIALERPSKFYVRHGAIRLSLPVSEAKSLLRLLYKIDISELTIMPSLDNAAKNFNYKRSIWG
ncbi:FRG domain-containing protein [Marinobacter nauticus]|uniref:FRG domain-containing protein n=1 Tax=Marinobacter nauticus TaxID=2743 RepID=UPI001CFE1C80|nr:FRG domain-containing protein [Marinobacter nauticus]